ncbi:hypothetical protein [Actinoplanes sp. NPDC089786]|uniref:hypothetical protein n=1 Tax=Actinoplanes sp. NPDC089786 TaxID=3155185 RepID=UPI00343088D9
MNDDQAPSYESEEFDRNLADLTAPDDVTPGDAASTSSVTVTTNKGQVAGHVAGDQVQTIISNYISRLRRAYDLTSDIVGEIVDTFVDRDFESISGEKTRVQGVIEILRERRCVVLLGEPGVGRRNAAVRALAESGLPLRQLPAWGSGASRGAGRVRPPGRHRARLPADGSG